MAKNNNKKPHAIFIAYPLQGHLIPSVHLATKLASKGFTITFVSTHSIHHQTCEAHPDIGEDIFASVRKSGLDIRYLTISDGLPVRFDRSVNHEQFMLCLLHVSSAHVEEIVGKIIMESGENEEVTCLIADTFFVWPSYIAKKFGLLHVTFWTETALVFTLYYHLDLLRANGHFASRSRDCRKDPIDYIPGVKSIEPKDMTSYLRDIDTPSILHQIIPRAFQGAKEADFVLCNTVQELEPETISALQAEKPFYAIGPIFPKGFTKSSVATSLWAESDCTQWLNTKPHGSVLYVSFGSYAHLTRRDLMEIAEGLLLSGVNFVWVLRPDIVSSNDVDPLPDGYRDKLGDRAKIVTWCCQIALLTHPAIGGFLTHCGWNSILESIWTEVPLLCFPLLTDQFTNRKLAVDDWKIGMNLSNNDSVTREEVASRINLLMTGKSGCEFKATIKEVKKKLENALKTDGTSKKSMDQFIRDLEEQIQKRRNIILEQQKKYLSANSLFYQNEV